MAKKAERLNATAMRRKHGDAKQDPDKLLHVRKLVAQVRELNAKREAMKDAVSEIGERVFKMQHEELPTLFMEIGVNKLSIEADGDLPAVDTKLAPFYKANIPREKAAEAFAWLEKNRHGDLIKNVFSVQLGMGDNVAAKKLEAFLRKEGIAYERSRAVPWNTLTAFVKEQVEDRKVKPSDLPLDLLGAYVGSVVTIRTTKQKD